MILAFEFEYLGDSEILEHFLAYFSENLESSVLKDKDLITLFAKGSDDELLKFSDKLSQELPYSIFTQSSKVYTCEKMLGEKPKKITKTTSNITPFMVRNFLENDKLCKNEFGVFSEVIVFEKNVDEASFFKLLEASFNELKEGKTLKLSAFGSKFQIQILYDFAPFDFVMPTNLKATNKIFKADERVLSLLASFEKPRIKLCTNALFAQNHPELDGSFYVKAPQDIFTYALCAKLFNEGINFIGVKELDQSSFLQVNVAKNSILALIPRSDTEPLGDYFEINLNKDVADGVYLVFKNQKIPLLFFPKFNSLSQIYEIIKLDESGKKLIENFSKNHELPDKNLSGLANVFELLCVVGMILGVDFQKFIDGAFEFWANNGVLIDAKSDGNEFLSTKFIKSAMSFYLATAGRKNIAFGCVQSLAGFLSDSLLKNELEIKDVVFSGDLFKNECISAVFMHEFSANFNVKFDKNLGTMVKI
ncbi:hypothetical protein CR66_00880 [Campylobacter mucosalis]|uniref:hypothetical protein n=1 Tax=Campylobacter mucosalis TaxID=202 RepID=UPI0004D9C72A|nr:hypothetical protein [Campylobacter mucosalis]KEA46441.1 hypothetical protein CR66_00880 [Campylobacter mucosalis]QKF63073.1 hypothetical protein CMCT_0935 [Campylobacter mucosalis]